MGPSLLASAPDACSIPPAFSNDGYKMLQVCQWTSIIYILGSVDELFFLVGPSEWRPISCLFSWWFPARIHCLGCWQMLGNVGKLQGTVDTTLKPGEPISYPCGFLEPFV